MHLSPSTMRMRHRPAALPMLLLLLAAPCLAADWPTWRHDASRGGVSPEELPAKLHLQWVLELPAPKAAWPPTQTKLQFDASYAPVVMGQTLFVASMVRDSVTAYDTATGKERWRFYAGGPVRFAPAAGKGKLYFASDDGHFYCLRARDGRLVWKVRGGPSGRLVLGNGRLISTWPARGGPLLYDGTVYFTAGIWPFMGIFVCALDAETGKTVWENSGSGSIYVRQPHGAPSFAGVAPQGYLAATPERLLVPGGRTVPAVYDRRTGEFLYFRAGGHVGGHDVMARGPGVLNHGLMFRLADGALITYAGADVADADAFYAIRDEREKRARVRRLVAYSLRRVDSKVVVKKNRAGEPVKDKKGKLVTRTVYSLRAQRKADLEAKLDRIFLKAGSRFYCGGPDELIAAVELPDEGDQATVSWQTSVPGRVWSMLAADGKLFVVTREGTIYCFGARPTAARLPAVARRTLVPFGATWKFLDDGSDPGTVWREPDFDDLGWSAGPAQLGYGDGDEATIVGFGLDPKHKHITTYFRRAFSLPSGVRHARPRLRLLADDGAVVYLNGKEALRVRMRPGAVSRRTRAAGTSDQEAIDKAVIDAALLVPGRNLLAVEVHQANASSSDISFDLELAAVPIREAPPRSTTPWADLARSLLAQAGVAEGYCLVLGLGTGQLAEELARQSRLHVVVIEPDAGKVLAARRRFDQAGLYGARLAVVQGEPAAVPRPPYLAPRLVAEDLAARGDGPGKAPAKSIFRALRPYGGTACLRIAGGGLAAFADWLAAETLPGAEVRLRGSRALLVRQGPLPGAANWTHHYADAANTVVSADRRVKLPLGLLWFGGASHEGILPRHGHGPAPHVVGGRLFIEGLDKLRAVDVFTGRLLWERRLKALGFYYRHTNHHPGAGAIGSNYVSLADGIYVAYGPVCLRLDPATGQTLSEFRLPPAGGHKTPYWGYLGIAGDVLVAGSCPVEPPEEEDPDVFLEYLRARYAVGSKRLVAMDRHSGKVLWQRAAAHNFRHNTIALGGGKVFCIDNLSAARLKQFQRRGLAPDADPKLYALDLRTGTVRWQAAEPVFGTWLAYSARHDVLVQATSLYRDRARDEARAGIAVFRAADGKLLWHNEKFRYGGPLMLHRDAIITQAPGRALDILTGQLRLRTHPLNGEPLPWTWTRQYGCNHAIASQHLLLFRSGAAGYFDLDGDSGTGNLGGFRSGCTSNLIAADGVLSAPDYTRTCTCAYQIQTSLAMVHDPEVELWAYNAIPSPADAPVRQVGLNFGAPGDRLALNGTLWLDCPSVGGPSPDPPVRIEPEDPLPATFRLHTSRIAAGPLRWVAASGYEGIRRIAITLADGGEARRYTVRLVFAEPRDIEPGTRVFSVALGGKTVLASFDVVKAAGGPRRAIVREFKAVQAADTLEVTLTPAPASRAAPILCGIELRAEDH